MSAKHHFSALGDLPGGEHLNPHHTLGCYHFSLRPSVQLGVIIYLHKIDQRSPKKTINDDLKPTKPVDQTRQSYITHYGPQLAKMCHQDVNLD